MAKKKKRRRNSMTIPLAPIVGVIPMVSAAAKAAMAGDIEGAGVQLAWNTIGVDIRTGKFDGGKLLANMTPLVVGLLVHKFVGGPPLNLNRTLARAKVPFIRI